MKKVVLILILIFSSLNLQSVSAASTYNYEELSEYSGFSEVMYETIVEESAFVTGRYTDNKEYISESIDEIKNYGLFWMDEQKRLNDKCSGTKLFTSNCLGDLTTSGLGYMFTIGDWIKKMFGDYDLQSNGSDISYDLTGYEEYFTMGNNAQSVVLKSNDYRLDIIFPDGFKDTNRNGLSAYLNWNSSTPDVSNTYWWTIISSSNHTPRVSADGKTIRSIYNMSKSNEGTVSGVLNNVLFSGTTFVIYKYSDKSIVRDAPNRNVSNHNVKTINNYIQNGELNNKPMVMPQPKAFLSCPDGTRINMTINGGTFLDVGGQVLQVSHDGTAMVDSQLCQLNWEKPIVKYINGIPVIQDPEKDKYYDIETGEHIKDDGEIDDELEDGCGIICAAGKLLSGLGSIAKSIAGLTEKILDGLLSLIVPKNLDFLTELFNGVTTKLNEKIGVTEKLKTAITSLFDDGGGNPLQNIEVNLPASDKPLQFGNVSFIEEGVPILRKVISAIIVLYTVLYIYRKIVGRGGVMEK